RLNNSLVSGVATVPSVACALVRDGEPLNGNVFGQARVPAAEADTSGTQLLLERRQALGIADFGEVVEGLVVVVQLAIEEVGHAVHVHVLPPGRLLTRWAELEE